MNCEPTACMRERVEWKQQVPVAAAAKPGAPGDAYSLIVTILERFPEARAAVVRAFRENSAIPSRSLCDAGSTKRNREHEKE